MAGNFYSDNNDSMDIKELATLNEDISDDFIDKLQQQLSNSIGGASNSDAQNVIDQNDDSTLFEEQTQQPVKDTTQTSEQKDNETKSNSEKKNTTLNTNFDDNFIKKYKAKLNKKSQEKTESNNVDKNNTEENTLEQQQQEQIEAISQGNIKEKPLTQELKDYNNSLDFLDENVKYSKYVIYIDPQNVDFIEGLTVKERKNLINGILRQQDDIAITKQRFKIIQVIIRHAIIAILTIAISIPVIYYVINASLEATIDNHRRSQSNWQTLYKEHGKITPH